MSVFRHHLPYVADTVNSVLKRGVWHRGRIKNGKIGLYKLDRLTVVGYIERGGSVYALAMKNGVATTINVCLMEPPTPETEIDFSVNTLGY